VVSVRNLLMERHRFVEQEKRESKREVFSFILFFFWLEKGMGEEKECCAMFMYSKEEKRESQKQISSTCMSISTTKRSLRLQLRSLLA